MLLRNETKNLVIQHYNVVIPECFENVEIHFSVAKFSKNGYALRTTIYESIRDAVRTICQQSLDE